MTLTARRARKSHARDPGGRSSDFIPKQFRHDTVGAFKEENAELSR